METKLINKLTKLMLSWGWSEIKMHIVLAVIIYLIVFGVSLIFCHNVETASYIGLCFTCGMVILKELLDQFVRKGFFDWVELVIGLTCGTACCILTNFIYGIFNK